MKPQGHMRTAPSPACHRAFGSNFGPISYEIDRPETYVSYGDIGSPDRSTRRVSMVRSS